MAVFFQAIGLVLVVEGLVLALAPLRLNEVLALLARLPIGTRRTMGLVACALGVILLWFAKSHGG